MSKVFSRFVKDESGVTAMEYGLIAAFIALVLVAVLPGLSANLNTVFGSVSTGLSTGAGG